MPTGCLVVFTTCTDPAREDEFNRWYSRTHLPDLLKTPGCVRARRYREIGHAASGRYLAFYEFDSDDLDSTRDALCRLAYRAAELGRHIQCIEGTPPGSYQSLWEEIRSEDVAPPEREGHYSCDPEVLAAIAADIGTQS